MSFSEKVAISALLTVIVPPTVLMGGTIPMLTQALARGLVDATRVHAFVYGFNTAGAFAGALADRYSRKRILIVSQAAAFVPALAMGLLTLTGTITTWQVMFFALLTGIARSFEIPTRQAFVPQLVDAFPARIDSVSIGKPTLEDVFVQLTGHRFWTDKGFSADGEADG